MLEVGIDFCGVGAFEQALRRLEIPYKTIFACDMDNFARQTYVLNYGEPEYYPKNVYEREIPEEPLDLYMTSPPCQSFSLAGKREGESSDKGVLFYNSHEFIKKNKPKRFIFENVKGLLSDDNGRTFQRWIAWLGGKSVNGNSVLFPEENSLPYHVYFKVLNAKEHGVPQNRERIFIIGIMDDQHNNFSFPKEVPLVKRIKDILENNVDEKYFLKEKTITRLMSESDNKRFNGKFIPKSGEDIANTITTEPLQSVTCNFVRQIGFINQDSQASKVYIAGLPTTQMLELNENGTSNTLTTVQKDNLVVMEDRVRCLTPRECFRLMDFPDSFVWPVSDSQAYKQAGNSIVVTCLEGIIRNLNLT